MVSIRALILINLYRYDVGAFIPGLDIVIPPVQPFRQIEGFLEESPLVRGSRRWDGGGGVEVGLHALPGVRLVIPTVISIIPCSKRQYGANKRTEMAQVRSDNPHRRIRCYQCGQMGRTAAKCPSPPSKTGSTPFRRRRLVSALLGLALL